MQDPQGISRITKDSDPVRWLHEMLDSAGDTLGNAWSQLRAHLPELGTSWPPDEPRGRLALLAALDQVREVLQETQLMVHEMQEAVTETSARPS